jgi:hypothetical protein
MTFRPHLPPPRANGTPLEEITNEWADKVLVF